MTTPMRETDEIDVIPRLERRVAKLEVALLNLLRAPYREWYPYAIGIACDVLDHPMRYETAPKFKENRCVCGKVTEAMSRSLDAIDKARDGV